MSNEDDSRLSAFTDLATGNILEKDDGLRVSDCLF